MTDGDKQRDLSGVGASSAACDQLTGRMRARGNGHSKKLTGPSRTLRQRLRVDSRRLMSLL